MPPSENSPYVDSLLLQALQQDDERALRDLFDTYYNASCMSQVCFEGIGQ